MAALGSGDPRHQRRPAMAAVAVVATVSAALLTGSSVPARAATGGTRTASAGTWKRAEPVPGSVALNQGGDALVESVSCASPGNCSAGGFYQATSRNASSEAFVADEVSGTWGDAGEVPGTAALNAGGYAAVMSVSCASPGNCSAGGYYEDSARTGHPFVVSEVAGTWGDAEAVAGITPSGSGGDVTSVSCATPGNCTAVGRYVNSSNLDQAFVLSQAAGTWGSAEPVPGLTTPGLQDSLSMVSCASAGYCSAGGQDQVGVGNIEPFVVTERAGSWGDAEEVPGITAINTGGVAGLSSVSCGSRGNCSAGGYYTDASGHQQAFVVSQKNGTWVNAEPVPGSLALDTGGFAAVNSVSCTAPSDCSAGGYYYAAGTGGSRTEQAFVADETSGTWGSAEEVPGSATLNAGGGAYINAVSCVSPGNCSAGGAYSKSPGHQEAMVAGETGGVWGNAEKVPGIGALNTAGWAAVDTISCASAAHCSAGGSYRYINRRTQAFVARET